MECYARPFSSSSIISSLLEPDRWTRQAIRASEEEERSFALLFGHQLRLAAKIKAERKTDRKIHVKVGRDNKNCFSRFPNINNRIGLHIKMK